MDVCGKLMNLNHVAVFDHKCCMYCNVLCMHDPCFELSYFLFYCQNDCGVL